MRSGSPLFLRYEGKHSRTLSRIAVAIFFLAALTAVAESAPPAKSKAAPNAAARVTPVAAEETLPNPLEGLKRRAANLPHDDEPPPVAAQTALPGNFQPDQFFSPAGLGSTLKLIVLMTVLSLAPSILIMTTCFVRFVIVLGLLRQALGTQQLPPNQILMALSLFLTFMVMAPVWQQSYDEGIHPYTNTDPGEPAPTLEETFERSVAPIRRFMSAQIERSGNSDTVWMFLDYQRSAGASHSATFHDPQSYDEVPLATLVSSFMLSELKSAFLIGFQIYLPFLVIDLVVATVLTSMGMMTVPPTLVSIPFKLLLFVLIDGWMLTVGMMLASVRPSG
ncbi:MAG TPA: flagellar type III secretion system pore protein FliP [Planctomycetaceae bacterium]|nr:flagellar type III secretion system pore protein FliP [Planctomycetaceae bacterium]